MIIILDADGKYQVGLSLSDPDTIELGIRYVRKESSLPVAQQLKEPALSLVQQKLGLAAAAMSAATAGEQQRSESATRFHNTMNEATPLLNVALDRLKGKYATDLGSLERWGLFTKINTRGKVSVSKPETEAKMADFLQAYVKRETELSEAEQITDPPLARLAALAQAVAENREARDSGSIQRQSGTQIRSGSATELLDLLKVACGVLIVTRCGGQVTESLSEWGYAVTQRTGKPAQTPQPPAGEPG